MLTSVLTSLQSLISPRFAVANFFPTLAFWFATAIMLFVLNAPFRAFARDSVNQTAGMSAVLMGAVLIGIAMSAYVLSAVLPAIQSLMEGNWPPWITFLFAPAQMKHYERLNEKVAENL